MRPVHNQARLQLDKTEQKQQIYYIRLYFKNS